MITPNNVLYHEIVGLQTEIISSTNPALVGLRGMAVLETRNTIQLRSGQSIKTVPKSAATKMKISTPAGACFISGSSMIAKPENRVSKL
jgi:ribonuclease P protein subunit POP4